MVASKYSVQFLCVVLWRMRLCVERVYWWMLAFAEGQWPHNTVNNAVRLRVRESERCKKWRVHFLILYLWALESSDQLQIAAFYLFFGCLCHCCVVEMASLDHSEIASQVSSVRDDRFIDDVCDHLIKRLKRRFDLGHLFWSELMSVCRKVSGSFDVTKEVYDVFIKVLFLLDWCIYLINL